MRHKILAFMICWSGFHFVLAQSKIPVQLNPGDIAYYGPAKIVVRLDPISRIPLSDVPFDRNFVLRIYFNSSADIPKKILLGGDLKSELPFYNILNAPDPSKYDSSDPILGSFKNAVDVVMPPLSPNASYTLFLVCDLGKDASDHYLAVFKLIYQNDIKGAKDLNKAYRAKLLDPNAPAYNELKDYFDQANLADIFKAHGGDLGAASADLQQKMKDVPYVNEGGDQRKIFQNVNPAATVTTLQSKIETSAKLSLVADAGVIYTGFQDGFNSVTPYIGINYSFRPMDSDLPFSYLVRSKRIRAYQRLTVNLGLTLNSLAKTSYRGNLFGNDNILIGVGFKLSHVVNLNGGTVLYNNLSPNPLLDKKTLGAAPYFGLSINLKIKDALGELAKVFTYGK